MTAENTNNEKGLHTVIIVLLIIISIGIGFFIGQNNGEKITDTNVENNDNQVNTQIENNGPIEITVIGDKRCLECNTNLIVEQLKSAPFLASANFSEIIDFSYEGTEELLKENNITHLPAFIFSTKNLNDQGAMSNFLIESPTGSFTLNVGSEFDPFAEICTNGTDDNNNGLIDCEDPTCGQELSCAPKVVKPVAELFIMSYCPYGTQAQKGYLEAMLQLGDIADMQINFVHYLMHGEKEGDENMVQSCIQKNEREKVIPYLQCFLKEGKNEECRKTANINEELLTSCIDEIKIEINYDEKLADTTRQFPEFGLDMEAALNYGVQGSPTFVLNGIKVDNVGRDAKSYADLICDSFIDKPEVCNEEFSNTTYDPNFGFTSNGQVVEGGCGQ